MNDEESCGEKVRVCLAYGYRTTRLYSPGPPWDVVHTEYMVFYTKKCTYENTLLDLCTYLFTLKLNGKLQSKPRGINTIMIYNIFL